MAVHIILPAGADVPQDKGCPKPLPQSAAPPSTRAPGRAQDVTDTRTLRFPLCQPQPGGRQGFHWVYEDLENRMTLGRCDFPDD